MRIDKVTGQIVLLLVKSEIDLRRGEKLEMIVQENFIVEEKENEKFENDLRMISLQEIRRLRKIQSDQD